MLGNPPPRAGLPLVDIIANPGRKRNKKVTEERREGKDKREGRRRRLLSEEEASLDTDASLMPPQSRLTRSTESRRTAEICGGGNP